MSSTSGAIDDEKHVVGRHPPAEHFNRAAKARGARTEQIFRAPDPQRRIVDDQHQREGRQQLEQFRRAIDPPQQQDLDQRADQRDRGGT